MRLPIQSLFAATLLLTIAQVSIADDAAKTQRLVDRAIEAMGGKAALEKTRYTIIEDKGTYYGMGAELPYEGRYVFDFAPNGGYRMEIKGQFLAVTKKDKAWISLAGNVTDLSGTALEVALEGLKVNYALSLIPLQKPNKDYKLSLADAETIDGEECEGIKIDHKGMPTVTVHFSGKTGLVKKTSYENRPAENGYQKVVESTVIHEYKKFDGVMSGTKMTINRDGKKLVDSRPQKVTYPKSLDASEFKKPE